MGGGKELCLGGVSGPEPVVSLTQDVVLVDVSPKVGAVDVL